MLNYLSLQVTTLDLSEGLDDLLIKYADFVVEQVRTFLIYELIHIFTYNI